MYETSHRRAPRKTVLVLVPEPNIRDLIASSLTHAGYYPVQADSLDCGQRLASQVSPDALLLDMDAGPDSASLIELVRDSAVDRHAPVLMLTSAHEHQCGHDDERCGADECIVKPFVPRDLVSRLTVHLKHPRMDNTGGRILRLGALELNTQEHAVRIAGRQRLREVFVPGAEFRLLQCLMTRPDAVHSRTDIVESVWKAADGHIDVRTVDQTVRRLRESLDKLGLATAVQTVRGVGYRLSSTEIDAAAKQHAAA
jgi:two-component system phosphate regulon response regulator PhoB